MKILVINPGSTSTKIAVFDNEQAQLVYTIRHSVEELAPYEHIIDQFAFRKQLVIQALETHGIPFAFDAIIGRGGLVKPIPGGVYEVNEALKHDCRCATRTHASNLGALLADELASELPSCRAFIADPVVVDELDDLARLTGLPSIPRCTVWHALNQKAIARRYAREHNTSYENLNLIVCHLGGGITVAAHQGGRAIDVNNGLDGDGPFSPERAGTLPAGQLVDLCFSGQYTQEEVKKLLAGHGGVAAHLGTTDMLAVENAALAGEEKPKLVLDAMIYNVAKAIGAMGAALCGKVDAILITGGIARSPYLVERLQPRIEFIAPVHVYPGEDEMEALALNALGALKGELPVQIYK